MPQLQEHIRITVKPYKGRYFLLELIQTSRGRCLVRRDGKRSRKISETTPTKIGQMLGRFVSQQLPAAAMRALKP